MGEIILFDKFSSLEKSLLSEEQMQDAKREYIDFYSTILERLQISPDSRFYQQVSVALWMTTATPHGFDQLLKSFAPQKPRFAFPRLRNPEGRDQSTRVNLLANTFMNTAGAMGYLDTHVRFSNRRVAKEDGTILIHGIGLSTPESQEELIIRVPNEPEGYRKASFTWR